MVFCIILFVYAYCLICFIVRCFLYGLFLIVRLITGFVVTLRILAVCLMVGLMGIS